MSEPASVAKIELQALPNGDAPAPQVPLPGHRLRAVELEKDAVGDRHLMAINDGDNGGDIMKRLKEVASHSEYQIWLHKLLGKKEAIFKGIITLQAVDDLEAQTVRCFVDMEHLEFLPQHTYAFENPGQFSHWLGFVHDNAIFYEGGLGVMGEHYALVCGWKTDKLAIAVLAIISTSLTVAVSAVVGVVCHSAELGVAVAAAMVALLAFAAFVMVKLAR